MKANQITAIGVSIIAFGVIAVGAKYGIKEYQNYKWKNNPNTSKLNQIYAQCLNESIMSGGTKFNIRASCITSELRTQGISLDEFNEWADWANSRMNR